MPKTILILALLLPASAPALPAQAEYYVRVGAVGASRLVRDVVISEITVRQSIAPMAAIGGSLPISPGYRAGVEATFSTGGYHSSENGVDTDLGTVRSGTIMLTLDGPVWQDFRWRAGLGAITYWPSEDTGVFLQGGPTRFLAGAGLDWRRPVHPHWDLMASGRFDYHRFVTDELQARGFAQTQGVGRISLSVGLARGLR